MAQTDRAWQTNSRPLWMKSKLPHWVFMSHMHPFISHTQTRWLESASSFGQWDPTQNSGRDVASVCEWVWYTLLTDKRHSAVWKEAGVVRPAPGCSFAWMFLTVSFKAAVTVMLLSVNANSKVLFFPYRLSLQFFKNMLRNVWLHISKPMSKRLTGNPVQRSSERIKRLQFKWNQMKTLTNHRILAPRMNRLNNKRNACIHCFHVCVPTCFSSTVK